MRILGSVVAPSTTLMSSCDSKTLRLALGRIIIETLAV
jgi:hypothetical protein